MPKRSSSDELGAVLELYRAAQRMALNESAVPLWLKFVVRS
ncbi:MAG: hypothetical protein K0S65_836 [Labilithrix sp.]|nr:hypothetical protein [Labilithrix sp.]